MVKLLVMAAVVAATLAVSAPAGDARSPAGMDAVDPRREAASEPQAAIDSTGLARRTAPGGDPTTRLNARAKAASER